MSYVQKYHVWLKASPLRKLRHYLCALMTRHAALILSQERIANFGRHSRYWRCWCGVREANRYGTWETIVNGGYPDED